jgi:ATP-dependent protease Clp ATPase subunit
MIVEEIMLDLSYSLPDQKGERDVVVTRAHVDALDEPVQQVG